MRKLAYTVLFASITALTSATAFAVTGDATSPSTDKVTGSPSVEANTKNPQGMSYTDKSNTSPGTNAKMDTPATTNQGPDERTGVAMGEHDKTMTHTTRKPTAKVAKDGDLNTTDRLPTDSTNGAAVNSTTGTSAGR